MVRNFRFWTVVHNIMSVSYTHLDVYKRQDNAIRMFMSGYLYNRDLGYNILLPDLQHQGESEGRAIQMGWKDPVSYTHLELSLFISHKPVYLRYYN